MSASLCQTFSLALLCLLFTTGFEQPVDFVVLGKLLLYWSKKGKEFFIALRGQEFASLCYACSLTLLCLLFATGVQQPRDFFVRGESLSHGSTMAKGLCVMRGAE